MRLKLLPKGRASKPFRSKIPVLVVSAIALVLTANPMTVAPASAAFAGMDNSLKNQLREVVVRPGVVAGRGRWVRPARYHWRPGGAIAGGAAIGFVTAAAATAWAGVPPFAGYCWYYTDATQTRGFWDVCP
jgi:hypothetical protein